MQKILDLLTSIKFWTIVGVIGSGIGLWFLLSDKMESSSLGLSTGSYSCEPLPDDKTYVLVNYLFDTRYKPVIFPIEICMGNSGNKTLTTASMRWYYSDNQDGYNVPLINDLVSPEKKLSVFYTLEDGTYRPFESGEGHSVRDLTPKTAAGSLNEGKVYCPIFADTTIWRHKFDVELKADETKTERFHVVMYTVAIFPDANGKFDIPIKEADIKLSKLVEKETSAGIINIISGMWVNPVNIITIDGIPFEEYTMLHSSIKSFKIKK